MFSAGWMGKFFFWWWWGGISQGLWDIRALVWRVQTPSFWGLGDKTKRWEKPEFAPVSQKEEKIQKMCPGYIKLFSIHKTNGRKLQMCARYPDLISHLIELFSLSVFPFFVFLFVLFFFFFNPSRRFGFRTAERSGGRRSEGAQTLREAKSRWARALLHPAASTLSPRWTTAGNRKSRWRCSRGERRRRRLFVDMWEESVTGKGCWSRFCRLWRK